MVASIESYEEFKKIIASEKVVFIDFWAEWCGPCRMMTPLFERLSVKHTDAEYYKIDYEAQEEICDEIDIRVMPTFMAFQKGTKIGTMSGALPKELTAFIAHHSPESGAEKPSAEAEVPPSYKEGAAPIDPPTDAKAPIPPSTEPILAAPAVAAESVSPVPVTVPNHAPADHEPPQGKLNLDEDF